MLYNIFVARVKWREKSILRIISTWLQSLCICPTVVIKTGRHWADRRGLGVYARSSLEWLYDRMSINIINFSFGPLRSLHHCCTTHSFQVKKKKKCKCSSHIVSEQYESWHIHIVPFHQVTAHLSTSVFVLVNTNFQQQCYSWWLAMMFTFYLLILF